MEWKNHKAIRRLYKEVEDGKYEFTYYNYTYSKNSAALCLLLLEEIHKDFPNINDENIFMDNAPNFPFELLLQFRIGKTKITDETLSKFEKMPEDLKEL